MPKDDGNRLKAVELAKRLLVDAIWKTANIEVDGITLLMTANHALINAGAEWDEEEARRKAEKARGERRRATREERKAYESIDGTEPPRSASSLMGSDASGMK